MVELDFDIFGRQTDLDEKPQSRHLASYHLKIPIREELSLLRQSDAFEIREGKSNAIRIVNSSRWKWSSLTIRTELEGITALAKIDAILDENALTQEVSVELFGTNKFLSITEKPKEVSLRLFATHGSGRTSVFVGELKVPMRHISNVEIFPKALLRDHDTSWLPINIVGRAVDIGDFAAKLKIFLNDRELSHGTDVRIERLSSKWLRIQVLNQQLQLNVSLDEVNQVVLSIEELGWRESLPIK
ncbi:MAG: hypothetical protein SGI77_15530 [Pirellulaceae bacterium]|nr:hypothetical protein [Pirellulaceae bacterium]